MFVCPRRLDDTTDIDIKMEFPECNALLICVVMVVCLCLLGDHRRPYPTDIDMRMGFLGRLSDLPINNQTHQSQAGGAGSFPDPIAANRATSQLGK